MHEKQLRPQVIIDQFAQKLLETSSGSQINLSATEKLISEITIDSDPSGLAVFLASELLWQLPNLKPEMREKINSMKMDFIKQYPVFADLNMRKQVLVDALDQFCQQDKVQTSYFQLEPIDDPNVGQILEFICQQNAAHCKLSYLNDKKWIFEPYTHPERNNVHGVWMSQNGEHFTNKALLKLERVKDIAFRQTYLIPAAKSAVGKKSLFSNIHNFTQFCFNLRR